MILIGLLGKAGAGKTTIAQHLEAKGFQRISFAERIKKLAMHYFQFFQDDINNKPSDCRTILQGLGSLIREQFDENYFISEIYLKIKYSEHKLFVIDDVRLEEEAEFIKEMNGVVVRLECPDRPAELTENQNNHITEQVEGIPYDFRIYAEFGDIEALKRGIEGIINGMF